MLYTEYSDDDMIGQALDLLAMVEDKEQKKFILAGIITATDKFITEEYAAQLAKVLKERGFWALFEEDMAAYYEQRWQEGQQEGRQEGRQEGQLAEAKRTVLAMLKGGKETDEILQYSELSRQEIEDLQKSLAP
ncbi:MAG: hypothetical protein FWG65_06420 [Turicibacter sp.]|nr:hypothetical protein [Turicibacter sp.]